MTFAAGLACEGLKPVVAIYSTFLQRGYDQLIHDVAIQNLPVRVRARPRRPGRRRRPDAPRRVRLCLPALHPQHDGDGAGRRERMPADAVHGFQLDQPGGGALSARQRARASRSQQEMQALPLGKGEMRRAGQAGRDPRLRQHAEARAGGRARSSMRRWPTCASSSRWTRSWWRDWRETHELLVTVEENEVMGGAGSAVLRSALAKHGSRAGAAAGPARPLRRSWRSGAAAGGSAGWMRKASEQSIRSRQYPSNLLGML